MGASPRKRGPPFIWVVAANRGSRFRGNDPVGEGCIVILFPAIDLKAGQAVRLKLGDMAQATAFNDDPAAQARSFEQQGFEYLHVVDLDGAFAGESRNGAAVEAIHDAVKLPVQLGGGIRTLAQIEDWLGKGLSRVILGTVALRYPELVRTAAKRFPGLIVVGIDARGVK